MAVVEGNDEDRRFLTTALAEARRSYEEGGIPVGALLTRNGAIIATGHNRSVQTNDPTSHGETDCLRNAGILDDYRDTTLYTTLSPCMMCSGAILFLGIPRLVIGERENFRGDIDFLIERGLEVAVLDDRDCISLVRQAKTERPALWRSSGRRAALRDGD